VRIIFNKKISSDEIQKKINSIKDPRPNTPQLKERIPNLIQKLSVK
jgi:hypothetical protein